MIMEEVKKTSLNDKNKMIFNAIILGYTGDMEESVKTAFSESGLMHILAVSGQHIGILVVILQIILGFLNKNNTLIFIKVLTMIAIVWLYALLTGLSPSVLRAAVMFSIISIGINIRSDSSSINVIGASAFFTLFFNPSTIMNIGFQLSYLAVLSIILFYDFIKNLLIFKYRISDYIWEMTAMSIAAQILTVPIMSFYFGKIPIYSLLANLIAIPAAFIILFYAVIYTPIIILTVVFKPADYLMDFLISCLYYPAKIICTFPFASAKFNLPLIQMFSYYLIITVLCIKYREKIFKSL